jgi:hypothetical protein
MGCRTPCDLNHVGGLGNAIRRNKLRRLAFQLLVFEARVEFFFTSCGSPTVTSMYNRVTTRLPQTHHVPLCLLVIDRTQ